MKKLLLVILISVTFFNLYAFENYIHLELPLRLFWADNTVNKENNNLPYGTFFTGVNIGWYGKFNNNLGITSDIFAGYLGRTNVIATIDFSEAITFYKFGLGPSFHKGNFGFYGTPNFVIIDNNMGLSGSLGVRLVESNLRNMSFGFSVDTPPYFFDSISYLDPKLSITLSIGIVFNLSYRKIREQELENQKLAELERANRDAEQRRQAHEEMLRQRGITEEQWQAEQTERRQRQIEAQREQDAFAQDRDLNELLRKAEEGVASAMEQAAKLCLYFENGFFIDSSQTQSVEFYSDGNNAIMLFSWLERGSVKRLPMQFTANWNAELNCYKCAFIQTQTNDVIFGDIFAYSPRRLKLTLNGQDIILNRQ